MSQQDLRPVEIFYQSTRRARSIWDEFRTFIRRGNVLDLAVGVIVGGAFGKIVSSLVADILMPPIGLLIGGMKFTSLNIRIGGTDAAPVTINYGNFLQTLIDFLIISACVFAMVKTINSLNRPEPEPEPPPPVPTNEEKLLAEIRDLLKERPLL